MKITRPVAITLSSIILLTLNSCSFFAKKHEDESKVIPFVLVDVLDHKYFEDGSIAGFGIHSINVPMDELEEYALDQSHGWDKEKTNIVLYCGNYKCLASGESAHILKKLGFKHVWAYEGGIAEWKHLGYTIDGPGQASYLSDFEMPEGYTPDPDVEITADQLYAKMKEFAHE